MTLSEFKAWFEGYTEGLEAAPTKAQFDRIKEKVKEINGTPITYPVYIDRYVEPYWRYYQSGTPRYMGISNFSAAAVSDATPMNDAADKYRASFASIYAPNNGDKGESVTAAFDSHAAMYAAGKAEALNG